MNKENYIQIAVVGDKNVGKNYIFYTFMREMHKDKIEKKLNNLTLYVKKNLKQEINSFLKFSESVIKIFHEKEFQLTYSDTLPENLKTSKEEDFQSTSLDTLPENPKKSEEEELREGLELVQDLLTFNNSLRSSLICFHTLYEILNSHHFATFDLLKIKDKFINFDFCNKLNEIKDVKNIDFFIICYSNNSFDNVDKWANKIKKNHPNTQFLLIENKIYTGDFSIFNGTDKAKEINAVKFMECTSLDSVVDVFNTAINIVLLNKKLSPKNNTLRFAKIHENAKIPEKSESGSIGLDLFSCESKIIEKSETVTVRTGIAIENNYKNTYTRIAPRSGLALKHGIDVFAGVIDRSYRGEIKVILFNTGDSYCVNIGDRIAQIIIEKVQENLQIEEVNYEDFSKTERGSLGFGSSGY